jgi:hypothetical protein
MGDSALALKISELESLSSGSASPRLHGDVVDVLSQLAHPADDLISLASLDTLASGDTLLSAVSTDSLLSDEYDSDGGLSDDTLLSEASLATLQSTPSLTLSENERLDAALVPTKANASNIYNVGQYENRIRAAVRPKKVSEKVSTEGIFGKHYNEDLDRYYYALRDEDGNLKDEHTGYMLAYCSELNSADETARPYLEAVCSDPAIFVKKTSRTDYSLWGSTPPDTFSQDRNVNQMFANDPRPRSAAEKKIYSTDDKHLITNRPEDSVCRWFGNRCGSQTKSRVGIVLVGEEYAEFLNRAARPAGEGAPTQMQYELQNQEIEESLQDLLKNRDQAGIVVDRRGHAARIRIKNPKETIEPDDVLTLSSPDMCEILNNSERFRGVTPASDSCTLKNTAGQCTREIVDYDGVEERRRCVFVGKGNVPKLQIDMVDLLAEVPIPYGCINSKGNRARASARRNQALQLDPDDPEFGRLIDAPQTNEEGWVVTDEDIQTLLKDDNGAAKTKKIDKKLQDLCENQFGDGDNKWIQGRSKKTPLQHPSDVPLPTHARDILKREVDQAMRKKVEAEAERLTALETYQRQVQSEIKQFQQYADKKKNAAAAIGNNLGKEVAELLRQETALNEARRKSFGALFSNAASQTYQMVRNSIAEVKKLNQKRVLAEKLYSATDLEKVAQTYKSRFQQAFKQTLKDGRERWKRLSRHAKITNSSVANDPKYTQDPTQLDPDSDEFRQLLKAGFRGDEDDVLTARKHGAVMQALIGQLDTMESFDAMAVREMMDRPTKLIEEEIGEPFNQLAAVQASTDHIMRQLQIENHDPVTLSTVTYGLDRDLSKYESAREDHKRTFKRIVDDYYETFAQQPATSSSDNPVAIPSEYLELRMRITYMFAAALSAEFAKTFKTYDPNHYAALKPPEQDLLKRIALDYIAGTTESVTDLSENNLTDGQLVQVDNKDYRFATLEEAEKFAENEINFTIIPDVRFPTNKEELIDTFNALVDDSVNLFSIDFDRLLHNQSLHDSGILYDDSNRFDIVGSDKLVARVLLDVFARCASGTLLCVEEQTPPVSFALSTQNTNPEAFKEFERRRAAHYCQRWIMRMPVQTLRNFTGTVSRPAVAVPSTQSTVYGPWTTELRQETLAVGETNDYFVNTAKAINTYLDFLKSTQSDDIKAYLAQGFTNVRQTAEQSDAFNVLEFRTNSLDQSIPVNADKYSQAQSNFISALTKELQKAADSTDTAEADYSAPLLDEYVVDDSDNKLTGSELLAELLAAVDMNGDKHGCIASSRLDGTDLHEEMIRYGPQSDEIRKLLTESNGANVDFDNAAIQDEAKTIAVRKISQSQAARKLQCTAPELEQAYEKLFKNSNASEQVLSLLKLLARVSAIRRTNLASINLAQNTVFPGKTYTVLQPGTSENDLCWVLQQENDNAKVKNAWLHQLRCHIPELCSAIQQQITQNYSGPDPDTHEQPKVGDEELRKLGPEFVTENLIRSLRIVLDGDDDLENYGDATENFKRARETLEKFRHFAFHAMAQRESVREVAGVYLGEYMILRKKAMAAQARYRRFSYSDSQVQPTSDTYAQTNLKEARMVFGESIVGAANSQDKRTMACAYEWPCQPLPQELARTLAEPASTCRALVAGSTSPETYLKCGPSSESHKSRVRTKNTRYSALTGRDVHIAHRTFEAFLRDPVKYPSLPTWTFPGLATYFVFERYFGNPANDLPHGQTLISTQVSSNLATHSGYTLNSGLDEDEYSPASVSWIQRSAVEWFRKGAGRPLQYGPLYMCFKDVSDPNSFLPKVATEAACTKMNHTWRNMADVERNDLDQPATLLNGEVVQPREMTAMERQAQNAMLAYNVVLEDPGGNSGAIQECPLRDGSGNPLYGITCKNDDLDNPNCYDNPAMVDNVQACKQNATNYLSRYKTYDNVQGWGVYDDLGFNPSNLNSHPLGDVPDASDMVPNQGGFAPTLRTNMFAAGSFASQKTNDYAERLTRTKQQSKNFTFAAPAYVQSRQAELDLANADQVANETQLSLERATLLKFTLQAFNLIARASYESTPGAEVPATASFSSYGQGMNTGIEISKPDNFFQFIGNMDISFEGKKPLFDLLILASLLDIVSSPAYQGIQNNETKYKLLHGILMGQSKVKSVQSSLVASFFQRFTNLYANLFGDDSESFGKPNHSVVYTTVIPLRYTDKNTLQQRIVALELTKDALQSPDEDSALIVADNADKAKNYLHSAFKKLAELTIYIVQVASILNIVKIENGTIDQDELNALDLGANIMARISSISLDVYAIQTYQEVAAIWDNVTTDLDDSGIAINVNKVIDDDKVKELIADVTNTLIRDATGSTKRVKYLNEITKQVSATIEKVLSYQGDDQFLKDLKLTMANIGQDVTDLLQGTEQPWFRTQNA